jgi:hypothetical protein
MSKRDRSLITGNDQITDDLLQRLSRVSKRHRATFRSCSQRDTFTRAIDPSSGSASLNKAKISAVGVK